MTQVTADSRGRITLGSKLVDEYGRRFWVVHTHDRVVLIPIPKNPLAHLRTMGRKAGLDQYTLKELKHMSREEAEKEVSKEFGVR